MRRLNTIEIAIGIEIDCDTDFDLDDLVATDIWAGSPRGATEKFDLLRTHRCSLSFPWYFL